MVGRSLMADDTPSSDERRHMEQTRAHNTAPIMHHNRQHSRRGMCSCTFHTVVHDLNNRVPLKSSSVAHTFAHT